MKLALTHIIVVILILLCLPLLMGADFMYWDAPKKFATIALANITNQGDRPEASQPLVLYTNVDAEISADTGTAAQLTHATSGDTLVTEYMLTDNGDGINTTGGTDQTVYTDYATFLSTAYAITHVADYNEVTVTLHVRASNSAGELADAGSYTAMQTLTVHW
jgi:hypothetical protein